MAELIQQLLRRLGLAEDEPGWDLVHDGSALPLSEPICRRLSASPQSIELTLRRLAPSPARSLAPPAGGELEHEDEG